MGCTNKTRDNEKIAPGNTTFLEMQIEVIFLGRRGVLTTLLDMANVLGSIHYFTIQLNSCLEIIRQIKKASILKF